MQWNSKKSKGRNDLVVVKPFKAAVIKLKEICDRNISTKDFS